MQYLLGVDVGTTSVKAVVYDPAGGKIIATGRRPTVVHHPRPEWSDFHIEEIWQATCAAIGEAVSAAGGASRVSAVAVASMGEAGVPLDGSGRPLYPAIAWYDGRADDQAQRLAVELEPCRVFRITGHHIRNVYTAPKLLWLREHAPEVLRSMHKWLCMQDYVLWKLAGVFATDYTVASRTMLFDQRSRGWSDVLLDYVGLRASQFPEPHPSGTQVGTVTPEAGAETGLAAGTLVVTGGHDHLCGALGAGVFRPGIVLDSTGTAQALLTLVTDFTASEELFRSGFTTYRYVLPEYCIVKGGSSAGGGAVMWLDRQLAGCEEGSVSQDLMAAAEVVPPGSQGLFWLPHLLGSGTPENDEHSRGALVGLTMSHGRAHIQKAMLEGLSFWLYHNLEEMGAFLGAPVGEVVAIGGATRFPSWMRLKAHVTGRRVRVPQVGEEAALGAALLAGIGAGIFSDGREAAESVKDEPAVYTPDPDLHLTYRRYYDDIYSRLYPALRDINSAIHGHFRRVI